MKILRKNDDFRKMPEKSLEEVLAIRSLLNQGWKYCAKEVYKEFVNGKKVEKKVEKNTEDGAEPVKVKKSDKKKSERK